MPEDRRRHHGDAVIAASKDLPTYLHHSIFWGIFRSRLPCRNTLLSKSIWSMAADGPQGTQLSRPVLEGEVLEGYWANLPALFTSLLKAWYGDASTAGNEFSYQWLPKNEGDNS
jgi:hypothetical protein